MYTKKIFCAVCLVMLSMTYGYAQNPFVYFLVSGIAAANGIYMSDTSKELHRKSNDYHNLGTASQHDAETASYLCGVYDAMASVAADFMQLSLSADYATTANSYNDMSLLYSRESSDFFSQSKSKEKRSSRYELYATASYSVAGICLGLGIWDLLRDSDMSYDSAARRHKPSDWIVTAYVLPDISQFAISRKF